MIARTGLLVVLVALAGCAELNQLKDSAVAAVASAGSGPQDAQAFDGTAPGANPIRSSSVGPTSAAAAPATKRQQVTIQNKKIDIVSDVIDEHCANIVDPPDTFDNLAALTQIAIQIAPTVLDPNASRTGSQRRHLMTRELRQQAARLNWLPMSVERRYGELLHRQMVDQGLILPRTADKKGRYAVADALLADLVRELPPNPYEFEIFIRKKNDDNAAALPGGLIYVDASLLAPGKRDLARFALAHELGHVLKRHQTQMTQARIIDTVSLAGNVDDMLRTLREPDKIAGTVLVAAVSGKALFGRHFQKQELQADACAVAIMDHARRPASEIDASIGSFLKSLPASDRYEQRQKKQPASATSSDELIEFVLAPVDSHPNFDQRRQNLQQVRADFGMRAPTPGAATKPRASR